MPIYEEGLLLCSYELKHASMVRPAVITFAIAEGEVSNSATDWATYLRGTFAAAGSLGSTIDNNVTLTKTLVYRGTGTDEPEVGVNETAFACTAALTSLPPNCAALVKKTTGVGGRRNRGRMYLPWASSESGVDETGAFNAADRTFIQENVDAWVAATVPEPLDFDFVIANRVYDLPWDDPDRVLLEVNAGFAVSAWTVETFIATQKRRMPRD